MNSEERKRPKAHGAVSPYQRRPSAYKETHCTMEKTALWDDGLKPNTQKTKNTFHLRAHSFIIKPCSYSLSSSTITRLSIANQSRAANPNRQSSEVVSINTSLTLSQLLPIREGTYVAKLQRAPRGYANVKDLPHDLPSFLSFKLCRCYEIGKKKQGLGACISVLRFASRVIRRFG